MNAPNPNASERDLEALRRAQRAHEPSMEEILASIRSIIADDRDAASAKSAPRPAPTGPQIVYSKDSPAPPRPAVEPSTQEPAAADEPLVSAQTDRAVSAAFEALSASLALRGAELAENMTREILRPMLKAWLDENLPSLVERLVRAEIQRVARGGR